MTPKEKEEMAVTARTELAERLADVQHEIWSHWMKCLFIVSKQRLNGEVVISAENAGRWRRQMKTDYADLSEKEKDSDRDQADKVLSALKKAELE